jgi:uncharacterized protein YbjT (DUF2867 family)
MACCTGKKVVVVFGATGAQGGSVARALAADSQFAVKAATRNPDSDKAKALKATGIETVKVDLDDAASVNAALQGAYGVFLITNYWEIFDKAREQKQAQNVIDAAKANGIKHLVFSSLNSTKAGIGKVAAHMDSKAETEQYIAKQGLPFVTVVRMAAYYENLLGMMKPQPNDKGEFVLNIPMEGKPMDMVCIAEIGECVRQIFARPDEFKGQNIGLSSQRATIQAYADILSKTLQPQKYIASDVTAEAYSKFGFPGAEDLAAMFELYQSGELFDVELTRRLNPNISTFEQWVARNKAAFQ